MTHEKILFQWEKWKHISSPILWHLHFTTIYSPRKILSVKHILFDGGRSSYTAKKKNLIFFFSFHFTHVSDRLNLLPPRLPALMRLNVGGADPVDKSTSRETAGTEILVANTWCVHPLERWDWRWEDLSANLLSAYAAALRSNVPRRFFSFNGNFSLISFGQERARTIEILS